ncbi:MAG: DUF1015 domain-containing protein [Gloeobacteraceae cyanobacterium ES-bin-144]|nr:DUF1015 domain-containing protein [Verrucomicrobiales bacterium]
MPTVTPFAALRPDPKLAARVCELPYDVMSSEEALVMAEGNPLSFLRVSKPEIDLPAGVDLYSDAVYSKGRENFLKLIEDGVLRRDAAPMFHLYRQVMGGHSQIGLVGLASSQEYLENIVKKHELTRPDKEDDRVRHIESLDAQTGPVFLTYKAVPEIDALVSRITSSEPEIDFTAPDGVRHSSWPVAAAADVQLLVGEFAKLSALYIADGHHRSAAAGRVYQSRNGAGGSAGFLTVIFPHNQMNILAYNRVLKDLNGKAPEEILTALDRVFEISESGAPVPSGKHQLGFYMGGKWYGLVFRKDFTSAGSAIDLLDVSLLQTEVLAPLFDIQDPRTSKRISFVGGIRGTDELEKLVNSGEFACAFSMYPTGIEDLMDIADDGGIMPPKSTWFEPKLRDAMFSHLL